MQPQNLLRPVAVNAFRTSVPTRNRASGSHHEDRIVLHAFYQQPKTLLALGQCRLGSSVRPAHFRLVQFSLHGCRQTCQVPFHHVVVGAGFHGGDSGWMVDGARYENEGKVGPQFLHQGKRSGSTETWEGVIGYDEIPSMGPHRYSHCFGGVDALVCWLIPAALEFPQQQFGVVSGIFDDQNSQRSVHGPCPFDGLWRYTKWRPNSNHSEDSIGANCRIIVYRGPEPFVTANVLEFFGRAGPGTS